MDTLLRDVAGDSYLHAAYEVQLGTGLGWDITGLDQKVLDSLISKPWSTDGRTFRDRCWVNKNDLVNSVTKNLTQGLLRGDSSQKIIEAVQKQFGVSRYKAGRLVNTETTYFNAVASKQCYKDLDVEMVEIIETLDSHTCSICGGLDGKTIPMAQYEPGVTVPPFHPNCRGTTAPAIDVKYAGERAARNADVDVYYVPTDMTYNDWKKSFVDGTVKEPFTSEMGCGIVKETGKKPITKITDGAIERVPAVKISGYTEEQCVFIQHQHKELLKYSRENNDSKEVAFVFDQDLRNRKEFSGSDDQIDFGWALYGKDLVVLHNHPRNSSFSLLDVVEFLRNDSIKTLTIVKNNGGVEIITKRSVIDRISLIREMSRLQKDSVKTGSDDEYRKIISKFLAKYDERGVLNWIR